MKNVKHIPSIKTDTSTIGFDGCFLSYLMRVIILDNQPSWQHYIKTYFQISFNYFTLLSNVIRDL